MIVISFSPTGSTDKVADCLASAMGSAFGPVSRIDLTQDRNFAEVSIPSHETCIIAVPGYGGRVPVTASERLRALAGNGAAAVVAAVYGNRDYEDALIELGDIAQECGFAVVAGVAAVAEHSVIRDFGAGRPDAADAEELAGFAARIVKAMGEGESGRVLELPGNRPYKAYAVASMVPVGGLACTGCGLCVRRCPVHAIPASDPKATDAQACIGCMRCIQACPVSARAVAAEALAAARSRMEKVCSGRKENALFV